MSLSAAQAKHHDDFPFPNFEPLDEIQRRTMEQNFSVDGCLYKPIDTHTMLDCGPSRPMPFGDDPDTALEDASSLFTRGAIVVRQEFFGGIVFDIGRRAMVYINPAAFDALRSALLGRTVSSLTELMIASGAHRGEQAGRWLQQLIGLGLLVPNESSSPARIVPAQSMSQCFLQAPFIVELEMTHACFRRCRHCAYNSSPDVDRSAELGTEQWKTVIDKLVEGNVLSIRFTGGDFLYRNDAIELLRYVDQFGIGYHFLSDTVALSPRALSQVAQLKHLEYVGSSLDGATAETHDWMRGDGAFETFCRRIAALAEAGIPVSVGGTLHKRNWKEVREMGRLATELGASYFEVGFLCPIGRGESLRDLVLEGNEIREALEIYLSGIRAGEYTPMQSHYVDRARADNPFRDMEQLLDRLPYQTEWPFSRLRVKPSGVTYTAGKLKNSSLSMGINIIKDDIRHIWRTSPNLVALRELGAGRRLHSLDIEQLPMELRDA